MSAILGFTALAVAASSEPLPQPTSLPDTPSLLLEETAPVPPVMLPLSADMTTPTSLTSRPADVDAGDGSGALPHDAMGRAMPPPELAQVRGTFAPVVGLDLASAESAATSFPIPGLAFDGALSQMREVYDNWNLNVAAPLIAAAVNSQLTNQ